MTTEQRRYLFHPLERRGLLLGLGAGQLCILATTAILALGVVRLVAGVAGLSIAAGILVLGAGGACWPLSGRPPAAWIRVIVAWARRCLRGHWRSPAPTSGSSAELTGSARRSRSAPLSRSATLSRSKLDVGSSARLCATPTALAGVQVLVAGGTDPIGIIRDRRAGTWSAVLKVKGRSFSLLDPLDKQRRLAAFGAVLAGLGRPGTPIDRLQWIERTAPSNGDGLVGYFEEFSVADEGPCRDSYRDLLQRAGTATQEHEVLVVLSVHARRSGRAMRAFAKGDSGAIALLQRELRLLEGHLRHAEVSVVGAFDSQDLVDCIRSSTAAPTWRQSRRRRSSDTPSLSSAYPMAANEQWNLYRTDDLWHCTYWISEWPRIEVGPDFFGPLLLSGGHRRVSVTMCPVEPDQAVREVESARTAEAADEELRRRAGFLSSARRRRESEGVQRRENRAC